MDARWQRIEEVFAAAADLPGAERAAFLDHACAGDLDLRRQVESLLSHDDPNDPSLEAAVAAAAPTRELASGEMLAQYRIEAKLGEGGMGAVYRAYDTRLHRPVALKVLLPDPFADPERKPRLLREARAASALNHPNIVTVYEIGTERGQGFIAMEYVEGRSLAQIIPSKGLPIARAVEYAVEIAAALAHAHQHGVIHRDLKSANIVITPEGRVKVLDFGLAKRMRGEQLAEATTRTQDSLTNPGTIAGTLAYMAPEQLRGQPADARSDIWALGVVLCEMSSGARPFQGKTGFSLISAILDASPSLPPAGSAGSVPPWLRAVIERCLEKDPARRYQKSAEVRAALEVSQSSATRKAWLSWRYALSRHRWLVLASVLLAVLACAAVLDLGGMRRRLLGGGKEPQYRALAVLPVVNLSRDPEQEYFTDGMTDALIADLSKIGTLRVISRTSVMQYKGAKKSLPEIARDLKVDIVLEASVVREAEHVRVTAQLIEAATDRHLWAENYERELTSILALQSEVARAVAGAIKVQLKPKEAARLSASRSVNPAT